MSPSNDLPTSAYPLVRKPGSTADVTVAMGGIVRNEMRKGTQQYRKDETTPRKLDVYNPATYDFVSDLMNMTRVEKSVFMTEKRFELVINTYTLVYYRPGSNLSNVIRQLDPIASQLGKIEKVDIVIELPTPSESRITTYEEYEASTAHKFLNVVLTALGFFKSLKTLNVVLALTDLDDIPEKEQIQAAWPYIFPFYDLKGFNDWKIMIRHINGRPTLLCGGDNERIDNLYKKHWPEQ